MEDHTQVTKENILGTWQLAEFKITKTNGITKDWGPRPNGFLIYDKSGHMSTSINSGADPEVSSKDLEKHILFYCGKYQVTGKHEVTHYVMNASNPKRINKSFVRSAKLTSPKQLELTAEGDYGQAYLLWKKA